MKIESVIDPQFSDTDALGHSNYQAVIRWFEVGRKPLYQIFAPDFNAVRAHQGLFLVMVSMKIEYKNETLIDKPVMIKSWISHIGKSSFHVSQESFQDNQLCSTGYFILVCYDFETKKSHLIPDPIRRELERFLER
jgi:acyl-CoA thioester hydrolase